MKSSYLSPQSNSCHKTLKSVVYREFLQKAMIPILFVGVTLIAFYFYSVNYMVNKTVDIMSQTAKQSLSNLSEVEARYIDNKLKYINRRMYEFQEQYQTSPGHSLTSFASDTLPTDLPWGSGSLLLDELGNTLVSSYTLHDLIDSSIISAYDEGDSQHYIGQDFILGDTPIENALQNFISGQLRSEEFEVLGKRYFVTQRAIEESGWRLVILTDMKHIYAPIHEHRSESHNLGFLVAALIGNFYIAFFIYLFIASQRFSRRITHPIKKITQLIADMNQKDVEIQPVSYVKIKELDELIDLNAEIQETKKKYQKISEEMHHKNEQLGRLAVTDPLTQAFNRLKLDEVLAYEVARASRDKNPLSIILLDIDKFKEVNDTYGHQAGDSVLIEITKIVKQNIRRTDVLGRWGGEEFLMIMPNTNLVNASNQAEKLRLLIEQSLFKSTGNITASFGVSSCLGNCSEHALIEQADQALYRAKAEGRNQVKSQDTALPLKLQLVDTLDSTLVSKIAPVTIC